MYFRDGSNLDPINFSQPILANQYISYDVATINGKVGGLAGKRVEITMESPINPPTSLSVLKTLFDGGMTSRVMETSTSKWYCTWDGSQKLCSDTNSVNSFNSNKIITITLPTSTIPTQFVVGNDSGYYKDKYFIGRKVLKIRIINPAP